MSTKKSKEQAKAYNLQTNNLSHINQLIYLTEKDIHEISLEIAEQKPGYDFVVDEYKKAKEKMDAAEARMAQSKSILAELTMAKNGGNEVRVIRATSHLDQKEKTTALRVSWKSAAVEAFEKADMLLKPLDLFNEIMKIEKYEKYYNSKTSNQKSVMRASTMKSLTDMALKANKKNPEKVVFREYDGYIGLDRYFLNDKPHGKYLAQLMYNDGNGVNEQNNETNVLTEVVELQTEPLAAIA